MFDVSVKDLMEPQKLIVLPPEAMVSDAARRMAQHNTGAVVVVANTQLLGIFTERDAVFRVLAQGLAAHTTPLHAVMTPAPATLAPNASYGHALLIMQEGGFRHLPVVDGGKVIGIITARNAMDPELEDFVSEARRREHFREEIS